MLPATSLTGDGRAWSVTGRLRERQAAAGRGSWRSTGRTSIAIPDNNMGLMVAAQFGDLFPTPPSPPLVGPTVLAFLFSLPRSSVFRELDEHGEYYDVRSGDTWDLFWPGYYTSEQSTSFERGCGAEPVGRHFAGNWFFNPREFNQMRAAIEQRSKGRWQFSGESDLVLVNAWTPERGEPTIDWMSTLSGQVDATRTLGVGPIVERISRDLEANQGDEHYGVPEVTEAPAQRPKRAWTIDLAISVIAEITAAVGLKSAGL